MSEIAIIGASGAVGMELLRLLEESSLSIDGLHLYASKASAGTTLLFKGRSIAIQELNRENIRPVDLAFFCAGSAISKEYIPLFLANESLVIDSSSAFRNELDIPLVIPEINPDKIDLSVDSHFVSPNCTASIMAMVLAPLHQTNAITSLRAVSFQAASGAGKRALEELHDATSFALAKRPFESEVFPAPIAFNCFQHESEMGKDGYVAEERKIIQELKRLLEEDEMPITIRSFRAPIERAHTIAIHISFEEEVSIPKIQHLLKQIVGIQLYPLGTAPTPLEATHRKEVLVGGLRQVDDDPYAIELIVCGDQLLKGAALNALQIAEYIETALNHS